MSQVIGSTSIIKEGIEYDGTIKFIDRTFHSCSISLVMEANWVDFTDYFNLISIQ